MIDILIQIVVQTGLYILQVWYWIVLGFILAGFVQEFIPSDFFARHLGSKKIDIAKGSVLGVACDVCSHGVLPIAVSIFKSGASRAATVAFIVATPWIGVMETLILLSFVGIRMTLIVSVLSVVIAFLTGLVISFLEKRKIIETFPGKEAKGIQHHCCSPHIHKHDKKASSRIYSALHYSLDNFRMIGKWFVIGFIAAGAVKVLIPQEIIQTWLGSAVHSVPFGMLITSVIEVCSEGTVPVIGALYQAGASAGAVFAMLMAGVATDLTEIGVISSTMGKRTAIAVLAAVSSLTLIFGYMINIFL